MCLISRKATCMQQAKNCLACCEAWLSRQRSNVIAGFASQWPSWLHVVLSFLLSSCILILLVLRDKIVHVTFGLSELHLVHALACVPVEECLAPEHRSEVLRDALEHFLNCCGVPCKGDGHLQAPM